MKENRRDYEEKSVNNHTIKQRYCKGGECFEYYIQLYLMRSYLVGSTPENNYTPVQPYRVTVSENTYSRTQFVDGYLTLYVACSGADSPRPLKLRNKPSTGQWFLWEQQLLTGIRIPQVADPWA